MHQPAKKSTTDRISKVMHPTTRRSTDRNLKVTNHQQPKSLATENHPRNACELERQIIQLQADLRRTTEQLDSTELRKRQVEKEVEEAKKQISFLYAKYEDSQHQRMDLAASEEARIQELRKLSQERDRAWQSELEAVQKQRSFDSAALNSAMNDIQRLKLHLSRIIESESSYAVQSENVQSEILELEEELGRTVHTVENLKIQLRDSEQAKAKAEATARETRGQLEITKNTVETLLSDGTALMESFNYMVAELEKSRAREDLLDETIKKLQAYQPTFGSPIGCDNLDSHMAQMMLELETTEVNYQEEQIRNWVLVQSAYELEEQLKIESILQQSDQQSALPDAEAAIAKLKAILSEKETQIRDISYMNEKLQSDTREQVNQMKSNLGLKCTELVSEINQLKAKILPKDTELQGVMQENELLKSGMNEIAERHNISEATFVDVKLVRANEQEAVMKLKAAAEELETNSIRVAMMTEQLDAAQASQEEMEVELKRLRVQSEQWKKAAEAAMAVLTTEKNGSFVEKLMNSPFSDDLDYESSKTRNNTMLRRMGELWKKSQK